MHIKYFFFLEKTPVFVNNETDVHMCGSSITEAICFPVPFLCNYLKPKFTI